MQCGLVLPEKLWIHYASNHKLNFSCYSEPFSVNPLGALPIVPGTVLEYEESWVAGLNFHFISFHFISCVAENYIAMLTPTEVTEDSLSVCYTTKSMCALHSLLTHPWGWDQRGGVAHTLCNKSLKSIACRRIKRVMLEVTY